MPFQLQAELGRVAEGWKPGDGHLFSSKRVTTRITRLSRGTVPLNPGKIGGCPCPETNVEDRREPVCWPASPPAALWHHSRFSPGIRSKDSAQCSRELPGERESGT